MNHLIHLLPDHIANQIAAGEVVQRPASVVKELLENALDAGADELQLIIKDAGKNLVQVIDNGSGMASHDARMAFERHATSKIRETDDLFNIRTLGFRGEALASIAAVAQVVMKTRLHDEELGTEIHIEGNKVMKSEPAMMNTGTSIAVRNLFFNVPARRNFLKSNPVETRHILNEFIRIAISRPEITLKFEHNENVIYDFQKSDLNSRLIALFGKDLKENLLNISEQTSYLNMHGLLGTPEIARKSRGEQFFFVNGRYIKSPYLNHAVQGAFKDLIPPDAFPFYCIFLEIDPKHVDINIHPTKTEIKFDDERTVYSLLRSVLKKGLGGMHRIPELDMGNDNEIQQAIQNRQELPRQEKTIADFPKYQNRNPKASPEQWEQLYTSPASETEKVISPVEDEAFDGLFQGPDNHRGGFLAQFQNQFILSQLKSSIILIDQHLAHQRILFEKFRDAHKAPPIASQQMLFPKTIEFSPQDFSCMMQIEPQLRHLGFDLKEFGKNAIIMHGVPTILKSNKVQQMIEEIIAEARETGFSDVPEKVYEHIAKSIAINSAIPSGKKLNQEEMRLIIDELFECSHPGVSPTGKPTYYLITEDEILNHFQRK